ncbi:hypothetical protein POM88_033114 [Heracleum sosnowskyi]|uniref:Ubiquitin-like protease family profile domain-containing protein n=1 Tax=Heracleum sosnowskyi TaxID=360622 RepID=A0AAD8MKQ8_9APIA|nr:hypothetical protein POM88_033114 [Heracleum sosnowskyi]
MCYCITDDRMHRLEDAVFGPCRNRDDDDLMEKHVKASFEPESYVHADVIYLYLRHLRRTMSAGEAFLFSLENSYSYIKLEGEFSRNELRASLAEDLKYRENSYILFVVHKKAHYSLVVLCLPEEDESSSAFVLHMDSFSYHESEAIFQTIEW